MVSSSDFEEFTLPDVNAEIGKALIEAARKLGFEIELPPRNQDENRRVFVDHLPTYTKLCPVTVP